MNILVTGCAGFIGSVTTELLLSNGYNVIGIDNLSSGYISSVPDEVVFYEGDVNNYDLLDDIFHLHNIDIVFHFAAESIIGKSMTDPSIFFNANISGGITLLDVMRKHNVKKIIQSSTGSSYGMPRYVPMDEEHPQEPINAYGESKYIFERILKWYQKAYQIDYVMFRYYNVGGSTLKNGERRKEETRLLPIIMKCINNNETLQVFGKNYPTKDGTAIRDYLHVVDVANAHVLAMNNFEKVKNDVYNLGSETGFSVLEIIKLSEKITGHEVKYEFSDPRPGDPPILIASRKKAIKKLGWNPENSTLEKVIEDTWRWFKENKNL
jgi:UDP-glucose 4-epimerase